MLHKRRSSLDRRRPISSTLKDETDIEMQLPISLDSQDNNDVKMVPLNETDQRKKWKPKTDRKEKESTASTVFNYLFLLSDHSMQSKHKQHMQDEDLQYLKTNGNEIMNEVKKIREQLKQFQNANQGENPIKILQPRQYKRQQMIPMTEMTLHAVGREQTHDKMLKEDEVKAKSVPIIEETIDYNDDELENLITNAKEDHELQTFTQTLDTVDTVKRQCSSVEIQIHEQRKGKKFVDIEKLGMLSPPPEEETEGIMRNFDVLSKQVGLDDLKIKDDGKEDLSEKLKHEKDEISETELLTSHVCQFQSVRLQEVQKELKNLVSAQTKLEHEKDELCVNLLLEKEDDLKKKEKEIEVLKELVEGKKASSETFKRRNSKQTKTTTNHQNHSKVEKLLVAICKDSIQKLSGNDLRLISDLDIQNFEEKGLPHWLNEISVEANIQLVKRLNTKDERGIEAFVNENTDLNTYQPHEYATLTENLWIEDNSKFEGKGFKDRVNSLIKK